MEKPVIIFGAKGIAHPALEIFNSNNVVVFGFLDEDEKIHGTEIKSKTMVCVQMYSAIFEAIYTQYSNREIDRLPSMNPQFLYLILSESRLEEVFQELIEFEMESVIEIKAYFERKPGPFDATKDIYLVD
jgi:hypothetical protein